MWRAAAAAALITLGPVGGTHAIWSSDGDDLEPREPPIRLSEEGIQAGAKDDQLCHDVSNLWLLVSNFGVFGLPDETNIYPFTETCGHEGYISCQFPARSGFDYLFQGAIWVGAIVGNDTLVSVGHDGWQHEREFIAGSGTGDTIQVYTNNPSAANYDSVLGLADQSFVGVYTDTMTAADDTRISPNHRKPLNISVKQTSHALSFSYAEDFVIFDYEIENLGLKTLKDLFVGIYLDGDVGPTPQDDGDGSDNAQDDVTGFRQFSADGLKEINAAWLADYDGPSYRAQGAGDGLLVPGVMGVRVVRSPAKNLMTTFNWWLSDPDVQTDWGPGRKFPGGGGLQGTPDGDVNKYLIMKGWQNETLPNPGIDPDQLDARKPDNSAVGAEDTRFLFSFGPFTIEPGALEKLPFTLGYFCAENFWAGGSVDENDFTDFDINAQWVQFVFDNPGVDTKSYDYGVDGRPTDPPDIGEDDGVLDTGDYFFGEDVGADGLPGTLDFGEGNGVLDDGEDLALRYVIRWIDPDPGDPDQSALEYLESIAADVDWNLTPEQIMSTYSRLHLASEVRFGAENGKLDEGDGVPDFSGPPPPPSPSLKIEKPDANHLVLKWNDAPEVFSDGFIPDAKRRRDFQGYRVYVSRTGASNDFTTILDLDVDQVPTYDEDLNITGTMEDTLGRNTGFVSILNTDADSTDYRYRHRYGPIVSNWPVYVAVTSYDNGYPPANLAPLESSVFINATQITPTTPTEQAASLPTLVVPNPYKITADYRGGWEKDAQSWTEFDRKIAFTNIAGRATIRVFTLAGDLVDEFEFVPDHEDDTTAYWDLISRNGQAIVSGIYLFAVEPAGNAEIEVGKFVVLK
ncbi:MAG: hypothetical protein CME06_10700 [Gemmatimonadetes bacterium]|nr:hypothetical protein [Gemmatimonadota bacterium]